MGNLTPEQQRTDGYLSDLISADWVERAIGGRPTQGRRVLHVANPEHAPCSLQ